MHGTHVSAISTIISQSQLDFGQIHLCEFPKTHTFFENWDDLSVGIQRPNIITTKTCGLNPSPTTPPGTRRGGPLVGGDPEGGKFISDQANKFGGAEGKRDFFSEDILMYF